MSRLLLLGSFFTAAPLLLVGSALYLAYLSYHLNPFNTFGKGISNQVAYAALPTAESTFVQVIFQDDARVEIVRQFLHRYSSPLEPHAEHFVNKADEYGLDYRLLPAIAMQESNLCKKAPTDSYNCWGWGIYGKNVTRFSGYEEAITTISKTLAKEYHGKGLISPEEIVTKYTPSDNGRWSSSVTHFMDQLALNPSK